MEPQIQFCTTADGVSIAYWTRARGLPSSTCRRCRSTRSSTGRWTTSATMYEWLAPRHRLIRIDPRNTGLSQRGVEDLRLRRVKPT